MSDVEWRLVEGKSFFFENQSVFLECQEVRIYNHSAAVEVAKSTTKL